MAQRSLALIRSGIVIGALGLGTLTIAGTSPASAHPAGTVGAPRLAPSSQRLQAGVPPLDDDDDVCYSNLASDSGEGYVSQQFESALSAYDSQGADDFTVSNNCVVYSVLVPGIYFQGPGPATSETVTFYEDGGGQPGTVISEQTMTGEDDAGSFDIDLTRPQAFLAGHTYWVSVQVNMPYATGGEWGWEASTAGMGSNAVWENPGDGFGTGCVSWGSLGSCLGSAAPDFMFALEGYFADTSTVMSGIVVSRDLSLAKKRATSSAVIGGRTLDPCSTQEDGATWTFVEGTGSTDLLDTQAALELRYVVRCTAHQSVVSVWADTAAKSGRRKSHQLALDPALGDDVALSFATVKGHTTATATDVASGASDSYRVRQSTAASANVEFGVTGLDLRGKPYHVGDFDLEPFTQVVVDRAEYPFTRVKNVIRLDDGGGQPLDGVGPCNCGPGFWDWNYATQTA